MNDHAALFHAGENHRDRIPRDLGAQVHRFVEHFHLLAAIGEELGDTGRLVIVFLRNQCNPFTFTFTLQDIQLQPSRSIDGNKELLRIDRVVADLAPISLLRNDLVSNAVTVEGLALNVIRSQDNRYNVEDLFAIRQQGEASDIISFSELPFLF